MILDLQRSRIASAAISHTPRPVSPNVNILFSAVHLSKLKNQYWDITINETLDIIGFS